MIKIFKIKTLKIELVKECKNSLFLWNECPKSLKRVRKTNRAICEIYEASVIGVRIWVIFFVWKKNRLFSVTQVGRRRPKLSKSSILIGRARVPHFLRFNPAMDGKATLSASNQFPTHAGDQSKPRQMKSPHFWPQILQFSETDRYELKL